jgi:FkbM family methyltransferase
MYLVDAAFGKREEAVIVAMIREIVGIAGLPRTFIDVGSNQRAEVASPFVEEGWRVLLIEPQQYCFERLRERFSNAPNVSLLRAACGETAGTARLRHGLDGPGSETSTLNAALDPWTAQSISSDSFEEVTVITLADAITAHAGFDAIGVLKIDAEAWDYAVLKGLDLLRHQPGVIVTEEYLWNQEAALGKHLLLEEAGYVNLGFVGYNTVWAHRRHGARWAYGSLGPWLRRLDASPPLALPGRHAHDIGRLLERSGVGPEVDYAAAGVRLVPEHDSMPAPAEGALAARVALVNFSASVLPSLEGEVGGGRRGSIALSYHCLDADTGAVLVWDGVRTPLARDLGPGEAVVLEALVELPDFAGRERIVVCFDLVLESVGWFGAGRDAPPARVVVTRPGPDG